MAKTMNKKDWFKRGKEDSKCCHHNHSGNAVYGLGFVGAAIYYVSTATGFWMGVLGILKAIVWPAMLVYGLLKQYGL
jgi:hypothetical protein